MRWRVARLCIAPLVWIMARMGQGSDTGRIIAAALIAIGIAVGGWFAGNAIVRGRAAERYVTVKGVAERQVQADLALWPIHFVVADDDLAHAQSEIAASSSKVMAFLAHHGIDASHAHLQNLSVVDTQANRYGNQKASKRFIISQTIMVRSTDPQRVFEASQAVSELVNAGVVLSSDGPSQGRPAYLFTKLSSVKPQMIAQAMAKARKAAAQFATNSGSHLGGIRHANQGVFVILPRDRAPGVQQERERTKILRVVSTIQYLLRS